MVRTQLDSVCPPPAGQCSWIAMEERTPLTAAPQGSESNFGTDFESAQISNGNSLHPESLEQRKSSGSSSKKVSFAEMPDQIDEVKKDDGSRPCCVVQ